MAGLTQFVFGGPPRREFAVQDCPPACPGGGARLRHAEILLWMRCRSFLGFPARLAFWELLFPRDTPAEWLHEVRSPNWRAKACRQRANKPAGRTNAPPLTPPPDRCRRGHDGCAAYGVVRSAQPATMLTMRSGMWGAALPPTDSIHTENSNGYSESATHFG